MHRFSYHRQSLAGFYGGCWEQRSATASHAETGERVDNNWRNKMKLKLMTVTTSPYKRQARILLTGATLDQLGFSPETLVSVFCENGQLTMKAQGFGLSVYRQVVAEIRKRKGHLLQVFSWTRNTTETNLVLEGAWLKKQGFLIGDPILIQFELGLIRVKHVPILAMGFLESPHATYQMAKVSFDKHKQIPLISINAKWLPDYGFLLGTLASLTDSSGCLILTPCQHKKTRARPHTMPTQVAIRLQNKIPCIRLAGDWISNIAYTPGDLLVIQCQENQLMIRHLDEHHLHF
jgi:hypothetical protein